WLQLAQADGSDLAAASAAIEQDRVVLPMDGSMALDDMDRFIIQTALQRHNFNVAATARALGTTRETMRYRIQKYALMKDEEGKPISRNETS
ncbi:MAG TPA: helix-turn-helix domain-containing protein, partial [Sedimentisphaerales bacterium]|nr:helix-turn-helix domain-containing protein [Sedimentisphaerales bacterium]